MNTRLILIIGIFIFIVTSSNASASGFWCDGNLIVTGDTKYEVLHRCGAPDFSDIRFEKRIKRDFYRELFLRGELASYLESELYREPLFVVEEVVIEEWIYNLGPTRFIRYLTFEDGRLVNITTGDYGY